MVEWIFDAALQVFEEHGYEAATTTRIAERAGVSVGSLYQYFPDKNAILAGLARRHLEDGRGLAVRLLVVTRDDQQPLEHILKLFVTGMLALHARHPTLHGLLSREAALPPDVHAALGGFEAELAVQVSQVLASRADVSVRDPVLAAHLTISTVEAATHAFVTHGAGNFDMEEYAAEVTTLLLRYLSGPTTR